MSKGGMSDFIREAIREKAMRDLHALEQRSHAFGGIDRARDALFTIATDLTNASNAVGAVTNDSAVAAKMKKLRKLVDDAHALATELADALGTDGQRDALDAQRGAILEALKEAGLDPKALPRQGAPA
ncbi:MAG: hypothetical protein JNK72_20600 [Myxococcales bacterium]|nr:hypothetical protein [Myxococcales bacterium]